VRANLKNILETKQCFTVKDLDIKGNDLIALGINQGKDIGITLNNLLNLVIEEKIENTREELIKVLNNNQLDLTKSNIIL
ncbi:MAG: hypothetical protein RR846_11345, partial [Oscillospiraceae bacterium]